MFAYRGDDLAGIFIVYEEESLCREEIFDIFQNSVDVVMTVPVNDMDIPDIEFEEDEEVTFDQARAILGENSEEVASVIQRAEMGVLNDEECQYQISRVLH